MVAHLLGREVGGRERKKKYFEIGRQKYIEIQHYLYKFIFMMRMDGQTK